MVKQKRGLHVKPTASHEAMYSFCLKTKRVPLYPNMTAIFIVVTRFDRSSRGDLEMTRMHRAEDWNQWMMQMTSEEQDFYDPEYFGRHFVVLLPPGPR